MKESQDGKEICQIGYVEDEEERVLAIKLSQIRTNIIKKYEGKELSSIEDEEDRKIVEIIANLDREYGLKAPLKNALEIKDWCERKNKGKPRGERNLPSNGKEKDEEERALAMKLKIIRNKTIKKYEGKELSSIEDEEDRKIVEIIRMLDNEYNSKKAKLEKAKEERNKAKEKRDKAKEQEGQAEKILSEQVSEQLLKEGVSDEKQ